MKNVCFLFGVNGVGKSVLARQVTESVPGAVQLSGSVVLRDTLGAASREELERMDAATKRQTLRAALTRLFDSLRTAPLIVCDTHLVVPLRKDGSVRYEDMWDDTYLEYGLAFVNVVASAEDVLRRRLDDERKTGRRRHADIKAIAADIRINDEAFRVLPGTTYAAMTLCNGKSVGKAARRLLKMLRGPVRAHAA